MKKTEQTKIIEFWDQNAKQWDQVISLGEFKSRDISSPALVQEILGRKFKSVLDIGCGEGWLSQILKQNGIQYLGIDGSAELIEIAKNKYSHDFKVVSYSDIENDLWKPKNLFDVAVFNFSLLDQNLNSLLNSVQNFLLPQGHILIQTLHPRYEASPYEDGWRNEDFSLSQQSFSGSMPWYKRTLESWLGLFQECGLQLKDIKEPKIEGNKPSSIIFILTK